MTDRALAEWSEWIALALTLGVLAAAFGAALARSLFAMCMYAMAAGAMASCALLAHGAHEAALGEALFSVGVAPFVLLSALLLSARAAKPRRRGRPWLTISAACAAAGVMLWVTPDLGGPLPVRLSLGAAAAPHIPVAAFLAPLIFVAGAACFALLGFSERGAFEHPVAREREP